MNRKNMETATYRESHTDENYGVTYESAYDSSTYYGQLWRTIERQLLISELEKIQSLGANRCLDFACGTGRILEVADGIFEQVTGVDVSDSMLTVARQKGLNANVCCQDITQSPLPEQYDVVTAFRFFRNAEDALRNSALQAIKQHLKPNGWLVANIHGNPYSIGMMGLSLKSMFKSGTARTISHSTFRRLLEQNGFEVVSTVNYSYLPRIGRFFPKWYRNLMQPADRWMSKFPILKSTAESTLFIAKSR